MTKKKQVILIGTIIALTMAALAAIVCCLQRQKVEKIQESYRRQNYAFRLGGIDVRAYLYVPFPGIDYYLSYASIVHEGISNENELQALLLLYEHDTGNTVTLEDVKDYLSQEYEEDGSLRMSSSYPQIQGYIDFMWKLYEEDEKQLTTLSTFERKNLPKNQLSEICKFVWGLERVGRAYLPAPYCISRSVTNAHKESKTIGYQFDNLPKEQVKQIVDWIFDTGWMDLSDWEAWRSENPQTVEVGSFDLEEHLASGVKPMDSLSDEVWAEWLLEYHEFMNMAE